MPNIANAEWTGNLKEGQGRFDAGSLEGELHLQVALRGRRTTTARTPSS